MSLLVLVLIKMFLGASISHAGEDLEKLFDAVYRSSEGEWFYGVSLRTIDRRPVDVRLEQHEAEEKVIPIGALLGEKPGFGLVDTFDLCRKEAWTLLAGRGASLTISSAPFLVDTTAILMKGALGLNLDAGGRVSIIYLTSAWSCSYQQLEILVSKGDRGRWVATDLDHRRIYRIYFDVGDSGIEGTEVSYDEREPSSSSHKQPSRFNQIFRALMSRFFQ